MKLLRSCVALTLCFALLGVLCLIQVSAEGWSYDPATGTFRSDDLGGGLLLAATYDASGRMTGVYFLDSENPETQVGTDFAQMKLFRTSTDFVPVSEMETLRREADLRIALITDGGIVRDGAFNQAAFEAAEAWSAANGGSFSAIVPESDGGFATDEQLTAAIDGAVGEGRNVLILPGFSFAGAIAARIAQYPDVFFIGLDISEADLYDAGLETLPGNLWCAVYQEEISGFLAGWAAVKLGYHKLGFLGGMAMPAVTRYGYGFVLGADAAAADAGLSDVEISYAYANQFWGDARITAAMEEWYAGGVEAVFPCGGGLYTSVCEAAAKTGGKVIGVDVDQAGMIDSQYGEGLTLTSAMKGLGTTVTAVLDSLHCGTFQGGRAVTLGVGDGTQEGSFVCLPDSTQWNEDFTKTDYAALLGRIAAGELSVAVDTEEAPSGLASTATVRERRLPDPSDSIHRVTVWVPKYITDLYRRQIANFNDTNTNGLFFIADVQAVDEYTVEERFRQSVQDGADLYQAHADTVPRLVKYGALSKPNDADTALITQRFASGGIVRTGGAIYTYPLAADNGYFLYYDRSVIPDADAASLEAILADCEAAGRSFDFEAQTSAWYLVSWFFGTGCVSEWENEIVEDGRVVFTSVHDTFDSPEGLIAAKGLKKLLSSPAHVNASIASSLGSGAAAVVSGSWDYPGALDALGDRLGVAELPCFEVDGTNYHLGSFSGGRQLCVRPQDAQPEREAALHLLAQYLTNRDCEAERYYDRGWLPANLEAMQLPEIQSHPANAALAAQNAYATPQGSIHGSWWDIAASLAAEIGAAEDEAGIIQALHNYSARLQALFS